MTHASVLATRDPEPPTNCHLISDPSVAILGSAPPRTHSLVHLGAHYGAQRGASLAIARCGSISRGTTQNLPTSPDTESPDTDCAHQSWQPPPQQPSLLCECAARFAACTRSAIAALSYLWEEGRDAVVSTCMQGRPARAPRSPPCRTLHHRACAGTHLPRSRAQSEPSEAIIRNQATLHHRACAGTHLPRSRAPRRAA